METVKDKHSGLEFCVPSDRVQSFKENGLADYRLIKWCEQYLSNTGTFIDIGCGIGGFSILLARHAKTVYAFEPLHNLINCVAVTTSRYNIHNIKFHNLALGSRDISDKFYSDGAEVATLNNELAAKLTKDSERAVQETLMKVVTLDSMKIKEVDLICLYADGTELDVLRGAALTLVDSNFPPIIIKVRGDEWYIANKRLVMSHLGYLGYNIHPIGGCENMYLASDHPLHKEHKQEKMTKQANEFAKQLLLKHDTGQTEDFTWYEWYLLARIARLNLRNQLSYDCAKRAAELESPTDKEYLPWEEISFVAPFVDKKSEGYEAAEKVIFSKHAPFGNRNFACRNQAFCMSALPFKKVVTVTHDVPAGYIGSSSSIIATNQGFKINLRTVNYSINANGSYGIRDPQGIVRTRNFLLDTNSELVINKAVELIDSTGARKYSQRIQGLEDLRLFAPGEFVCTCLEVNDKCIPQMCYGQCDDDGNVTKFVPLMINNEVKCEKNWLPVYLDGQLHIIYTVAPFRLFAVDTEIGVTTLVKEVDLASDKNLDFFRGSATLIPYRNGWLGTIHQVYHDHRRMYFHRFVWLNQDFTELKYSKAFYFESPNIEFNLSICHSEHGLLVPYSVADNCSKIGILAYEDLDKLI